LAEIELPAKCRYSQGIGQKRYIRKRKGNWSFLRMMARAFVVMNASGILDPDQGE
jgi:hypothetical protein